jgi:hypothetical protein
LIAIFKGGQENIILVIDFDFGVTDECSNSEGVIESPSSLSLLSFFGFRRGLQGCE